MTSRERMLRIDWDDLRLFLEIARAGTLTAAATRLKLSQPTAGRRLRTLEEAIGAALFQRSANGFRLTDEGEVMLVHAEHMESDAIAMERKLLNSTNGLQGSLRLSCSDWFASQVLAEPVADFSLEHPAVTVELLSDARLYDLQRREADMAFRFVPFADPNIVQRKFVTIEYGLYASQTYLDRFGDPADSQDGENHRLITMDSALEQLSDVVWLRGRFSRASLAVRSNNREAQGYACRQGAGVAILPKVIGDRLALNRLGAPGLPNRDIWIGYHEDMRRLLRLRSLVDFLTKRLPAQI